MTISLTASKKLQAFLENTFWQCSFAAQCQAAADYLASTPRLTDVFDASTATRLKAEIKQVDHLGVHGPTLPAGMIEAFAEDAGFSRRNGLWFESSSAAGVKIYRADGDHGAIEIMVHPEGVGELNHIAWRVKSPRALVRIGNVFDATLFRPPAFLGDDRIACNRARGTMFRYFDGERAGHPIRVEFCS